MRKLQIALASCVAVALLLGPAVYFLTDHTIHVDTDGDLDALQGKWVLRTVERDGMRETARDDCTLVITGRKVVRRIVEGPVVFDDDGRISMLHSDCQPKEMDLIFKSYQEGETQRVLYRLEGTKLLVCMTRSRWEVRPSTFQAAPGSGLEIHTYERQD